MPESNQNGGDDDFVRKGELFVLKSGIDDVKDEQAKQQVREHERREEEINNQNAQLGLNRSLVRLTFALVVLGIAGSGISVWQSVLSQKAARAAESAAKAAIEAVDTARASNGTNRAGILESNRLTTEAINQNERAISQNERLTRASIDAAIRAAGIADESLIVENRPWIYLNYKYDEVILLENQKIAVKIGIRNEGRTPAFKFEGCVSIEILPLDRAPNLGKQQCIPGGYTISYIQPQIGPATRYETFEGPVLTRQVLAAYKARRLYIATHVRFTYHDGFGVPHWIQFCEPQFAGGNGTPIPAMSACANYNAMDNDRRQNGQRPQ